MRTIPAAVAALALATCAIAQDMPVPKIFKGMQGQKGRWQMEMLEASGRPAARGMTITVCTDNLMDQVKREKAKAESSCKTRLLKDTADEAVIESTCNERTNTVTMKRESAKALLMTMQSSGPKGPQTVKMRYTHLGACREGQGTMSLDPNGEECKQMKAQAAQMDAKMRERILAMCK